jgi:hypothetical protein
LTTAKVSLVPKVGYYLPFALVGGVFTSIGCGLISTLTPTTAVAKRVGFQIIQGFQGMGFQIPILAVHNAVSREDVSVATALVVFSQNLSGAIFISIAQVIFTTELEHGLAVHAPEANAAAIIAAGAAAVDVRNSVSADLLPGVLLAYSNAFDATMYLAAGSAVAGFIAAFGMGWKRIKSEEEEEKEKPAAE